MASPTDRKLYLGPRLRVLRRELGLNQAQMADELGVSPSYLNHLERNQRPLTAPMLLRLADTYDIDVRDFVAGANQGAADDLHAVFADPLLREIGVPRQEVTELAENYPGVSEVLVRLYRALGDLRQMPDRIEQLAARPAAAPTSIEWLRDHFQSRRGHLAELDHAAEALSAELGQGPEALRTGLRERLKADHGVRVDVVRDDVLLDARWHYDIHRRRLLLAESLTDAGRQFAVAIRLAHVALADAIAADVERAGPPDEETAALVRRALVNYAAAAIVMPYARFLEAASASHHDMDLLQARFGVSYEQAAQRLVTLGRSGAKGVPFFLLKVNAAGIVSKRVSADGAWLARAGGGCARWGVQRALRLPGESVGVLVDLPDGETWATLARAVPTRGQPAMIVLGCPARHREQIAAFDGATAAPIPIGSACHLCERPRCSDRALPPVTRALALDATTRASAPYPFRAT